MHLPLLLPLLALASIGLAAATKSTIKCYQSKLSPDPVNIEDNGHGSGTATVWCNMDQHTYTMTVEFQHLSHKTNGAFAPGACPLGVESGTFTITETSLDTDNHGNTIDYCKKMSIQEVAPEFQLSFGDHLSGPEFEECPKTTSFTAPADARTSSKSTNYNHLRKVAGENMMI